MKSKDTIDLEKTVIIVEDKVVIVFMVGEVELDSIEEEVNRTQTGEISPVIPGISGNKTLSTLLVVKSQDVQYVNPYIIGRFLGETLNLAVLDNGCTKTVCGEQWLKCYIDSLSETEKKTMKSFKSNTEFRFGDGKSVISEQCVSIPCRIAGVSVNVETDVVKSEIPLLLSKDSMKKAGTKIDFVNDKINIFGKEINLTFTSSGHYTIPLNEYHKSSELMIEEQKFTEILLTIDNIEKKSNKEKQ